MTKKHYEAIAAILKQDIIEERETVDWGTVHSEKIAAQLADYFATDNPRFDRDRFLTACGYTGR